MTETFVSTPSPWDLRLAPPLPSVAQVNMAMASKEAPSPQQLIKLVKPDPSFSAELLRFANSPMFGAQPLGLSPPQKTGNNIPTSARHCPHVQKPRDASDARSAPPNREKSTV